MITELRAAVVASALAAALLCTAPAAAAQEAPAGAGDPQEKVQRIIAVVAADPQARTAADFLSGLVASIDSVAATHLVDKADVRMEVGVKGGRTEIAVYDTLLGSEAPPVLEWTVEGRNASMESMTAKLFPEIEAAIRKTLVPRSREVVEVVTEKVVENIEYQTVYRKVVIHVTTPEGSFVRPAGAPRVPGSPEGIDLEASPDSSFSFRVTKTGYVPKTYTFAVGGEDLSFAVDLEPLANMSATGRLGMWEVQLNPAFEYHLVPGLLHVDAGLTQNIVSVASMVNGFDTLHGAMIEPFAGIQLYLMPADRRMRAALQTHLFLRLAHGTDSWYLSKLVTWGIEPALRLESRSFRDVPLFVEIAPRIFWSSIADGRPLDDFVDTTVPTLNLGGHWHFQPLPQISLGIRREF